MDKETQKAIIKYSIISVCIFFLLSLILFFWAEFSGLTFFSKINSTKFGQFGSYFGGIIASIFAVASFILLILTYRMQSEELSKTEDLLTSQVKTQKLQRFENNFFSLVSNLNESISLMQGELLRPDRGGRSVYEGRDFLQRAFQLFKEMYFQKPYEGSTIYHYVLTAKAGIDDQEELLNYTKDKIDEVYSDFYKEQGHNLGHYFRLIFNLIKTVERHIDEEDQDTREYYIGLIQAQLSNEELALIMYNAISKYSKNTDDEYVFREKLDNYGFLENIHKTFVLDELHLEYFPNTDFKLI